MPNIDFYYPFDSISGDRTVTAATERRFWSALFSDGVVGADAFDATETNAGVYSIGQGVAIVGGTVGGITSPKSITVQPPMGAYRYIVLRLDTTNAVRDMQLLVVSTMEDDTDAQLETGGQRDLVLYRVQNNSGTYEIQDFRTYCTSFDNVEYEHAFDAVLDRFNNEAALALYSLSASFQDAIDEANTENAGLYGSQGRQGFINPCFAIAQRYDGSSWTQSAGTQFTADHWAVRIGGRTPSSALVINRWQDGARNTLYIRNKAYTSGTASGASCLLQNIEGGVRTFCANGQQFTVSFDAKATTAQKLAVEPVQVAQTGQAGTSLAAQTVNLTSSWQRFSLTFTGSVTPTADQEQDVLKIGFFFAWANYGGRFGTDVNLDNTVSFANMQINRGTSALPCYEPPRADQLEQCLRYYADMGRVSLSCGAPLVTLKQVITSPLPLTRRLFRTPTPAFADNTNVSNRASVEVAAGTWRHGLVCQLSSNSAEYPVFVVTNTDTAAVTRVCFARMALDAEIYD